MKNKHILITLLAGIIFITIGSFLKITHQSILDLNGKNFLSVGLLIELIATIMLIIKLSKNKKN